MNSAPLLAWGAAAVAGVVTLSRRRSMQRKENAVYEKQCLAARAIVQQRTIANHERLVFSPAPAAALRALENPTFIDIRTPKELQSGASCPVRPSVPAAPLAARGIFWSTASSAASEAVRARGENLSGTDR